MSPLRGASVVAVLMLSACMPPPEGEVEQLSEAVRALAAPGQNLTQVRIESDGCYWYRYDGPVETTFLPLLTRDDRMICARTPSS